MKPIILCLLLVFFNTSDTTAQKKPKENTVGKTKAPTQREMQDAMKEAQGMMDDMIKEMSDEDKKMMDSLGIKMPDLKKATKNIPAGVTNKQLANAWESENRLIPKKDASRIAAIPKSVTGGRIPTYIATIQKNLMQTMNPDVIKQGEKLYGFIKTNSKSSAEAGNMAIGFWIAGKPELALYLMGQVCIDDPAQTDNLSNYAAMLSMQGGQHLAIPLLNNLNRTFPQNSTLLNNLGQAWFGLGDIDKAGKYLDSAISLSPFHPQANLTKASILENKGDRTGAIECVKRSIKKAYTKEKEDKLNKLGHRLSLSDVRVPFKPGPDLLGLSKTKRPDYPMSVSEINALLPYWNEFNAACDAEIEKLEKVLQDMTGKYEKSIANSAAQSAAAISQGLSGAAFVTEPIHARKAGLAMAESQSLHEAKIKKMVKSFEAYNADITAIRNGRKYPPVEAPCETHLAALDHHLTLLNERKRAYDQEALQVFKDFINERAYWAQFTSTDEMMYAIIILSLKIDWLRKNLEYQPLDMREHAGAYAECVNRKRGMRANLADFDDVGCKIRDTTNLVVWQFISTCTKLISKLNLKVIEYTRYENFERAEGDYFVESSLKIAVEQGIGNPLKKGPLKAEAKVGAAVEFEFDQSGVKDIVVSAEAKAGVGHNMYEEPEGAAPSEIKGGLAGKDVFDTTIEIGIEARSSLISGKGSVSGTGKLSNIKIVEW